MVALRSLLPLALSLAVLPVAVGCAGGAGSQDDAAAVGGSCGSPVGSSVADAADSGASSFDGTLTSSENRVVGAPYVGGQAIGDGIVELISQAQHEVAIEFFDIETESWLAARVRDAIAALPSSVHVYVLVNPDQHQRFFGFLAEKPNTGVDRLKSFFHDPKVTVGMWNRATSYHALRVMHTKQVVVDGQRAFMTDANLQRNSDPVERGGNGWYQMGMVVEGSIARSLRGEFAAAFRHATPSVDLPAPPAATTVEACTPMTLLGRAEGDGEDSSADRGYAALFRAATREVHVITPNLNDDGALSALSDATANADVYVVLSKGFNDQTESIVGQGGTNEHNVSRLAGMAKNKCHLHMRWFAQGDGKAVDGNVHGASHAKWASADGTTMILGSQNLDTQSWKHSRELSLAVDDADTTARYDDLFAAVWDRSPVAYEASGCP